MTVVRLRQVMLPSVDVAASADTILAVLGLEEQFRDGDRWVQFRAGDVSLAVAAETEGAGAPPAVPVPVFEVDDLDAHLGRAHEARCDVAEVRDMGGHGRVAGLTLPDGAWIVLHQR